MKEFKDKFDISNLKINQIGNWIISLRQNQVTLGSLILSLDRDCAHFGEITKQEGEELSIAFNEVERILEATFNPDKINYLALMMIDNQVHFHVIPRYRNSVEYEEREFIDKDWPKPPNLFTKLDMSDLELNNLKILLKSQ